MNDMQFIDQCLEAIDAGASMNSILEGQPDPRPDLEPMLRTALLLRSTSVLEAPIDFKRAGRERLLERTAVWHQPQVETAANGSSWNKFILGLRQMMTAPAFALLLAFLLLAGFGLASSVNAAQRSLPGDFLFPAKYYGEQFRLMFAPEPIELRLEYASRRLQEATMLQEQGRQASVEEALDLYNRSLQLWALEAASSNFLASEQVNRDLQEQVKQLKNIATFASEPQRFMLQVQLRETRRLMEHYRPGPPQPPVSDPTATATEVKQATTTATPIPGASGPTQTPQRKGQRTPSATQGSHGGGSPAQERTPEPGRRHGDDLPPSTPERRDSTHTPPATPRGHNARSPEQSPAAVTPTTALPTATSYPTTSPHNTATTAPNPTAGPPATTSHPGQGDQGQPPSTPPGPGLGQSTNHPPSSRR